MFGERQRRTRVAFNGDAQAGVVDLIAPALCIGAILIDKADIACLHIPFALDAAPIEKRPDHALPRQVAFRPIGLTFPVKMNGAALCVAVKTLGISGFYSYGKPKG